MRYFYIFVVIFSSHLINAQEIKSKKFICDINFEQGMGSFAGIGLYANNLDGLQWSNKFYPSVRIECIKMKNLKRKHSFSVGLVGYERSYSQRAVDFEYYNYPSNVENRVVYYYRDFKIINLVLGYKYYHHLNERFMIFGGIDIFQPIYFYSNNSWDNVVIGYNYTGSDVKLKVLHEEFQAVKLNESVLDYFSIPVGILVNVNKKLSMGMGMNYKFRGNLLALDKMEISLLKKGQETFSYNQNVGLYNKFLYFSILIKYHFI